MILSIIIPVYNEEKTVIQVLEKIKDNASNHFKYEVLVIDETAPAAVCTDLTVELEFDGTLLLDTDQLLLEATDNCGELEFAVESYSFDCSNLGIIISFFDYS